MVSRYGCSNALRVIGQVLQQRGIDLFDLRCSDGKFFLQCGGTIPPYLELVKLNYSLAEIKTLDLKARARRGHMFKLVDFESFSEIFRAVGRRIDDCDGQLLRAYCSDGNELDGAITIEYQTRDRRRHAEEFLMAAAGEDAARMCYKRSCGFAN